MNNLPKKEFDTIVAGSVALAANAGFINVVSIAGVFPGVTVSHVTGSVSRVAISLVQTDWDTFFLVLSVITSFMFGSFISGYIVGDSKFKLGANYGYTLILESVALFVSFLFLHQELVVGEWAAAFACGLQNAMATSYSGLVVRTTHMTGICTDIGNILGQACRTDTKAEFWRLRVHVPLLCGYLFGGVMGQIAWLMLREYSFIIPSVFTGGVAVVYLTLPYIRDAAEQLKLLELIQYIPNDGTAGPHTDPRVRDILERQKTIDHYAQLTGRNVDDDIKRFLQDLAAREITGTNMSVVDMQMQPGTSPTVAYANNGQKFQQPGLSDVIELSPVKQNYQVMANAVGASNGPVARTVAIHRQYGSTHSSGSGAGLINDDENVGESAKMIRI